MYQFFILLKKKKSVNRIIKYDLSFYYLLISSLIYLTK